jgi:hypothetical protein
MTRRKGETEIRREKHSQIDFAASPSLPVSVSSCCLLDSDS